ncbi:MAG: hypothetical protein EBZ62_05930, partial [Sphingobacteriia bacterium]|nr:hypothetical protein [Sphingobacteriia bacterium]
MVNSVGCDSVLTLTVTVASGSVTPQLASLSLPELQAVAGQVVRVPVYAEYVSQVDAFNLGVHFDPSVMTYQGIDISGTALSGQPFVIGNANGTRVEVSYFALSGMPALDVCGDVLMYLEFMYHGPTGGISPLVWDDSYTSFTASTQAQYTGVVLDNGLVYSNQVTTAVPQSNGDVRVCAFTDATLTVTGVGVTSYQWMVSTDGGSSFVNLVNGSGITGAQSATLVLSSVLTSMSGNLYMCRVDGSGGPVASVVQRLRVDDVVGIGMTVVATPAGIQCPGTQVTYSAQPSSAVDSAVYRWTVNGVFAGSDSQLVVSNLSDGDVVSLALSSSVSCTTASAQLVAQVGVLPLAQAVTGGGSFCPGLSGVEVGVSGSEVGVSYVLLLGGVSTGDTIAGTGAALSFGSRTVVGQYSVGAINALGCTLAMTGTVQVDTFAGVQGTVSSDTSIYPGQSVQLQATGGVSYAWSPSVGLSSTSISNPVASPQQTTTYSVVITNGFGCTQTLQVEVTILPVPVVNAGNDTVVCINSGTLSLGGVPPGGLWTGVGVSGGQFDPQVSGVGVWSAVYTYLNLFSDTLQIEVRGLTASTQTRVICVGDSVVVGSVSYNTTGIYTVQLTGSNGCDSVVTLNLTVLDSDTTNLDEVVCFGGSYTVGSSVYSTTGVHVTTLTGSLGCDSVVILNLTVLPQATSVVNDTICSSSAGVTIGTQTYSLAGTYTVTLLGASAAGCDSVVTLNLSVNPPLSLAFTLNGSAMGSVATGGSQSLCNNDDVLILLSGV